MIERLSNDLFPTRTGSWSSNLYNYWRRYYFFGFDDDVLIFFDFSSLTQHPRTVEETAGFKSALAHMGSLYNSFPVLVVDHIPETVMVHGHHLPYLEKGWCWAESNMADLGDNLSRLSPHIISLLASERQNFTGNMITWEEKMMGTERPPMLF